MTLNEKTNTIKYLKNLVVKYQKYQFAAWLRDKERDKENEMISSNVRLVEYFDVISYSQYQYLLEIISDYEKIYNSDESVIRDYLYKNWISVIRSEKLDKLFGDDES